MNTGEGSRSGEDSALKDDVTYVDVRDSEEEVLALVERAMKRVVVKHDLTGFTCYRCKEKGHLGRHCPKIAEEEEIANRVSSFSPGIRWLLSLPNLEEDDVTDEIVHEEEEGIDDSEDEFFALLTRVMKRAHTKGVSEDYMCYLCKKKGHLVKNCPTRDEEGVAAELVKPHVPMAAQGDEISDREESAGVPNTLDLTGKSDSEREEEVSNKRSMTKVKSLDLEKTTTTCMSLWNTRKGSVMESGKGKTMSNNSGKNLGKFRIDQTSRFIPKDQGYYGAQHSEYIYYHPEYGIPVLVYSPMH